ncbi:uncharacterized protein [Procambarus clarkii]|uniref:uncharacterized protein isoform X1 n=1 Tax=Procambarus clarkii TaxID=6728 RepID=UPI0037438D26
MDTMINTPTRRMSLRRKRNTKGTDGTESPVSKKSSPLMESKDEEASANTCTPKSQVYNSRRIRGQTAVSPGLSSGTLKNNEQSFHTPNKRQQHHTIEHRQQHSPDTPLICSQLCGTQECEVVWDCNSPGYSKDDLKRMPGGDTGERDSEESPVVFVAPAFHRLFPRARGRPPPPTIITNTTAQLDELLDQLSSRRNSPVETRGHSLTTPLPALDFRQRRALPEDESDATLEEDTSPSTSSTPGLLQDALSQPFDIRDENTQNEQQLTVPATKNMNLTICPDDSLWGDDLNMGICDISEVCDTDTRHFEREKVSATVDGGRVNVDDQVKDVSNMSSDIFDDDLFNESVIRTTQAMEEAMNDSVGGNYFTNVVQKKDLEELERKKNNRLSKYDNSSEHSLKSDMDNGGIKISQKSVKPNNSYRNLSHTVGDKRSSSRHVSSVPNTLHNSASVNQNVRVVQNSTHSASTAYQNLNDNTKDKITSVNSLSKSSASNVYSKAITKSHINLADDDSCSPVLGKTHVSPTNNPVRKVRNSFRLNVSSPRKNRQINAQDNGSFVQSANSNKLLNSVSVNERCSTGSGSVNSKSESNLVVTAETRRLESVSAQKISVIHPVVGNESYQANTAPPHEMKSTVKSNYGSTYTSISSKKSFNNCSSSQVGNVTNTGQTMRGPLLRSHSTDNPKSVVGNLPSVTQRSKSSVEGDASREFGEDDEFFRSLLSVLPEDENLLENPPFQSEISVLKGKEVALPQGNKCSVNTVRFLENFNTNSKHLPNEVHSDSYACRKDDAKKPHTKPVAATCTTLKDLPNQPQTLTARSRAQRSLIQAIPTTTANPHNSRLGPSMVSCVIVDNLRDTVQSVGQVDTLTSQPALPTPPQQDITTSDILDDDLFEDEVLTLLDEVESLYGSQQAQSDASNSQQSLSQPLRCTQDEIARKKEAAQRLREEKQKLRNQLVQHQNC